MRTAIARHDALLRAAVESSDGEVVKTTGDGLMAIFSSVAAALSACVTAQQGLMREHWGETGPLRVRMGCTPVTRRRGLGTTSVRLSTGPPGSWLWATAVRYCCRRQPPRW
jgi:class 3 adenylate cyclase